LFHFSTIIHLPSEHTTVVWSIDANVPLLGAKFSILFTVCCIILIIQITLNTTLLFTKIVSRFRFITKFKPLIDAYQGPYKIKFYYWTGVQLVIRVAFYGISSLDRKINFTIGIMLLTFIAVLHGFAQPFKVKHKNYQEMMFIANLQWIFVVLQNSSENVTFVNILLQLAGLHFICIVFYHFATYAFGGVIRKQPALKILKLFKCSIEDFHRNRRKLDQFELQENMSCDIPEVTYNYNEYQEPLVGVD